MVDEIKVTGVKNIANRPSLNGRELTDDEIKKNYLQIGQVMVQRDLYNSLSTQKGTYDTYMIITLQDGTTVKVDADSSNMFGESSYISVDNKGSTVFENFTQSGTKINGTDAADNWTFQNCGYITVDPMRGNDNLTFRGTKRSNLYLYGQTRGEVDSVDIDNQSGILIGYDGDNDYYGPYKGYKNIKGQASKDFAGTSVFKYVTK